MIGHLLYLFYLSCFCSKKVDMSPSDSSHLDFMHNFFQSELNITSSDYKDQVSNPISLGGAVPKKQIICGLDLLTGVWIGRIVLERERRRTAGRIRRDPVFPDIRLPDQQHPGQIGRGSVQFHGGSPRLYSDWVRLADTDGQVSQGLSRVLYVPLFKPNSL